MGQGLECVEKRYCVSEAAATYRVSRGSAFCTVLTRTDAGDAPLVRKMPFYVVGKEISLDDVRLTLDKMPDRLFEHPATVLALTKMSHAEAPWLTPNLVARRAWSGASWYVGRRGARFRGANQRAATVPRPASKGNGVWRCTSHRRCGGNRSLID